VCKLKKALYGLKQAPRAWYSRLDKYLQQAGFRKGSANSNLYIKVSQGNILLIEVYVDDIIFGSDDDRLSQKFAKDMQNEFEMSLLGPTYFCRFRADILSPGRHISGTTYFRDHMILGGFRHMVFADGFLFPVKELGFWTNPGHWVRVLD
jgi:hypothetical protein